MRPSFNIRLWAAAIAFLAGALIALNAKYLGFTSWRNAADLTVAALRGAPLNQHVYPYFDASQFGQASLRKQSSSQLPLPIIVDRNLEPLANFAAQSQYRRLASGIARLDLLVTVNGRDVISSCSAAYIARDLLLTARHCLQMALTEKNPMRASLRFNYFDDIQQQGSGFEVAPTLLEDGETHKLDYALLALNNEDADRVEKAGLLPLSLYASVPSQGEDLFVIHYPLGDALHLSRRNCRVTATAKTRHAPFSHSCGTLPGTSGAPIFDDATRRVVGIHVRGDPGVIRIEQNEGRGLALTEIAAVSPHLRKLLEEADMATAN